MKTNNTLILSFLLLFIISSNTIIKRNKLYKLKENYYLSKLVELNKRNETLKHYVDTAIICNTIANKHKKTREELQNNIRYTKLMDELNN